MRPPESDTRIAIAAFFIVFIVSFLVGLAIIEAGDNNARRIGLQYVWRGPLIANTFVGLAFGIVVLLILYIIAQATNPRR